MTEKVTSISAREAADSWPEWAKRIVFNECDVLSGTVAVNYVTRDAKSEWRPFTIYLATNPETALHEWGDFTLQIRWHDAPPAGVAAKRYSVKYSYDYGWSVVDTITGNQIGNDTFIEARANSLADLLNTQAAELSDARAEVERLQRAIGYTKRQLPKTFADTSKWTGQEIVSRALQARAELDAAATPPAQSVNGGGE